MSNNVYVEINEKLDFLLEDHGVDFDYSQLDKESLETFHIKADALLKAHKCDIPDVVADIEGLQPKLDLLIQGHGETFDDSGLDRSSFDTVIEKLDVLQHEHS